MPLWTPAERAYVRELEECGETDAAIATELNRRFGTARTRLAVHLARRRWGKTGRPLGRPRNTERDSRILAFLTAGQSLVKIAGILGTKESDMRRVMQRMVRDGLVRRTGGKTRNVRYVPTLAWTRDRE